MNEEGPLHCYMRIGRDSIFNNVAVSRESTHASVCVWVCVSRPRENIDRWRIHNMSAASWENSVSLNSIVRYCCTQETKFISSIRKQFIWLDMQRVVTMAIPGGHVYVQLSHCRRCRIRLEESNGLEQVNRCSSTLRKVEGKILK